MLAVRPAKNQIYILARTLEARPATDNWEIIRYEGRPPNENVWARAASLPYIAPSHPVASRPISSFLDNIDVVDSIRLFELLLAKDPAGTLQFILQQGFTLPQELFPINIEGGKFTHEFKTIKVAGPVMEYCHAMCRPKISKSLHDAEWNFYVWSDARRRGYITEDKEGARIGERLDIADRADMPAVRAPRPGTRPHGEDRSTYGTRQEPSHRPRTPHQPTRREDRDE